jgi:phosphate transport system substrate-binding protein
MAAAYAWIMRIVIPAVVMMMAAVACGRGDSQQQGQGTSASAHVIAVDGSSTVFPISEAVAEEFQRANRGQRVTVGSTGTGGGIQKFCRGEIDIADASRPIKSGEIEMCQKAGVEFIELPVAYDGLAVVVNPKNTWATDITVAELKKIWQPEAQGRITTWNQIRAGWPNKPLRLFGPGPDSGTFDSFTEAIVGKTDASRGDFTASEDDNVLVQGVAGDEGALGYFGVAYYEANKDKLKLVPVDDAKVDNGAGPVLPTAETVRNGTYQPLSRPLFIYVNKAKLQRAEVKSFVDFYLQYAGRLATDVGYIPLADAEQQQVTARWTSGKTGTMYAEGIAVNAPLAQLLASGR